MATADLLSAAMISERELIAAFHIRPTVNLAGSIQNENHLGDDKPQASSLRFCIQNGLQPGSNQH